MGKAGHTSNGAVATGPFTYSRSLTLIGNSASNSGNTYEFTFNTNRVVPTDIENRPYNIYALPLISY